jgi:hypothetical protein
MLSLKVILVIIVTTKTTTITIITIILTSHYPLLPPPTRITNHLKSTHPAPTNHESRSALSSTEEEEVEAEDQRRSNYCHCYWIRMGYCVICVFG